jgi:hypothetical protein
VRPDSRAKSRTCGGLPAITLNVYSHWFRARAARLWIRASDLDRVGPDVNRDTVEFEGCERGDLNPHALRHRILSSRESVRHCSPLYINPIKFKRDVRRCSLRFIAVAVNLAVRIRIGVVMKREYIRRSNSKCPWQDRQPHTSTKPETLTDSAIRHIKQQIAANNYRPLPYLGIAKKLFRCADCHAVWPANTIFERVAAEGVCGVYDHTLIWKPR